MKVRLPDSSAADDDANTRFFIFAAGYQPAAFDMSAPPNIVVHQGTVEDWMVTNTTFEDHVFHIHQLHFQVLEINGRPVRDPEFRDTIDVPHLSLSGPPPSVRLRMDFRGDNLVGTFLYHCHLAAHWARIQSNTRHNPGIPLSPVSSRRIRRFPCSTGTPATPRQWLSSPFSWLDVTASRPPLAALSAS